MKSGAATQTNVEFDGYVDDGIKEAERRKVA